jgi:hypothetical protein
MDALAKLSSVMGLSLTSGINLYATVAVVGIVTKFGMVEGLPAEFEAFNNNFIIFMAVILYLCEFAADKVPGFDSLWDSVHTIIRPFGAALIALTVVGDAAPPVEVVAGLFGASLAAATHTAKAGTRLVVNTSPEPFSNIGVSVAEDAGVVGMSVLVMTHPYISLVVSLIILLLLITYGPGLFRGALLVLKAIPVKLFSTFAGEKDGVLREQMPDSLEETVDTTLSKTEEIKVSLPCSAQKIKNCGRNRKGYVVVTNERLLFAFRRFFKPNVKHWLLAGLERPGFQARFLFDVLRIKSEGKFMRFLFLKNRSTAAQKTVDILGVIPDHAVSEESAPDTASSASDASS